jgi:hypothetical protein
VVGIQKKALPKKPKKRLGNILLLNKVGKVLREEPTLGRAIAMKEFIFVDGVNVRKLIDDLGYLILLNISRISIPIHEVCNAVELSNYLKYPFVYSRLKFDEKKWLRL